jgi:hypothetical protein
MVLLGGGVKYNVNLLVEANSSEKCASSFFSPSSVLKMETAVLCETLASLY